MPTISPQTLAGTIEVQGHGLHGNRPCIVRLVPSLAPVGIRFVHLGSGVEIPVHARYAGDVQLATTLVKDGVRLQTIEHLLSALVGLGVDHLRIEVDGPDAHCTDVELPILDGSAAPWMEAILSIGIQSLAGNRRSIKILKTVEVRQGSKWIRVSPYPGLRVRYAIDFDHAAIGYQCRELTLTPEKYRREVGAARTFCLEHEIDWMRSKGLALGGSLDNAVVFAEDGPLNETLRFEDEAVRHKILDLVGDLALVGGPLEGFVEVHAGGHALHVALTQAILADPTAWAWSEGTPVAKPSFTFRPAFAH